MKVSCPFCSSILFSIDKDHSDLSEIMTNGTLEFLRFCFEPTEGEKDLVDKSDHGYSWISTQNKSQCDSEFNVLKEELRSFRTNLPDQSFLLPILDKYEEKVVTIYVNGTNNHSSVDGTPTMLTTTR